MSEDGPVGNRGSVRSPGRRSPDGVLREDSPDLADDGGMILAQMARRYERLGRHPVEMGTLVRDQTVAPAGTGRVAPVRDDGMGLDRRRESELIEAQEDRRSPLELVDAGG